MAWVSGRWPMAILRREVRVAVMFRISWRVPLVISWGVALGCHWGGRCSMGGVVWGGCRGSWDWGCMRGA